MAYIATQANRPGEMGWPKTAKAQMDAPPQSLALPACGWARRGKTAAKHPNKNNTNTTTKKPPSESRQAGYWQLLDSGRNKAWAGPPFARRRRRYAGRPLSSTASWLSSLPPLFSQPSTTFHSRRHSGRHLERKTSARGQTQFTRQYGGRR